MASHAHSNFTELGKACVDEIVDCTLICNDGGLMKANPHCQRIAQFMWWALQRGNRTVEYRLGMTLLVDPKPSIIKWRDAEIAEAIGATEKTSVANPGTSPDSPANLFSGALIDALGSLKMTMNSINLKEASSAGEGSKHFARPPEHLKILMYRISYVPGAAEPTSLTTKGQLVMLQHSMSNTMSLLKTALHQKYGLSIVVQPASVQALRVGQLLWDDPMTPGNHSVFQYYSQMASYCEDSATELAWHLLFLGFPFEKEIYLATLNLVPTPTCNNRKWQRLQPPDVNPPTTTQRMALLPSASPMSGYP
jgi:hypothetical protein